MTIRSETSQQLISKVVATIGSLDLKHRESFGVMMDEVCKVLSEDDLTEVLETSKSTIEYWKRRESAPTPSIRQAVRRVLVEHLSNISQ